MKRRGLVKMIVLALLTGGGLALADDTTAERYYLWLGGNGDWDDDTKWECDPLPGEACPLNGYPDDDTDQAHFIGTGSPEVQLTTETINRLRVVSTSQTSTEYEVTLSGQSTITCLMSGFPAPQQGRQRSR